MYKLFFNDNPGKQQKKTQRFSFNVIVSASFFIMILLSTEGFAQNLCITNTSALPDSSAMLDVMSSNRGLLVPRVQLMSTTDIATIHNPATSLLVYNKNIAMTGGGLGFWYWNGTHWVQGIGTAGSTVLAVKTDSILHNTFIGNGAGFHNTIAIGNTVIGEHALYSNITGNYNTAIGINAGQTLITGSNNTYLGYNASSADGLSNATAIGANALVSASNSIVLGGTAVNAVNVGIGTETPNSSLQVVGGFALKHTVPTINQNYSIQATDCFVDFSKFTASATCNLPSAIGIEGRIYMIRSLNGSIIPPTGTIGGSGSSVVTGTFTSNGIGSNFTDPVTSIVSGMVTASGNIAVTDLTGTVFTGTFSSATGVFTGPVLPNPNPMPSAFNGTITGNVTGITTNTASGVVTGIFNGTGVGSFVDPLNGTGTFTSNTVNSSVTGPVVIAPVVSTINIHAFGTEIIDAISGGVTQNSYFLPSGSCITLISNGTGWERISGL